MRLRAVTVLAAAAVVTVSVVTGCSSSKSTGSPAVGGRSAVARTPSGTAHGSAFAGQDLTVILVGYDGAAHLAKFQLAKFYPGGDQGGAGQYDTVQGGDTSVHELPLAAAPVILASSEALCPGGRADSQGRALTRCTVRQLVTTLQGVDPTMPPPAVLHVDGAGDIDKVTQLFVP